MEIERQRGISVATAVMGFEYKGTKINILVARGVEDFAEDTYRTLTAVDSVIIVIDALGAVDDDDYGVHRRQRAAPRASSPRPAS